MGDGQEVGSDIGGTIGGMALEEFGPAGEAVGQQIGGAIGGGLGEAYDDLSSGAATVQEYFPMEQYDPDYAADAPMDPF